MDFENLTHHRLTVDNYQFDLSFQEEVLNFSITCVDTFAKYTAIINNESIKHNKNIEFFFATPADLFAYFISDCINNLRLKDGSIFFNIQTKLGKSVKNYQCIIQTIKEELSPDIVMKLKFERLQKQIDSLKIENIQLKQKIQHQQLEVNQIKKEIEKCGNELGKKDEIITEIFRDLKQFDEWRKSKENLLNSISHFLRRFQADETNPHNKKFTQIGNKFRKNCGGSWDVLMSKNPIEKNEITRFNIKQIKAGSNGSFMYGIGTDTVRGLNRAQDSKEYIGYYQNTGFLYDQAESKKGGPKIKDGDTVSIEVDTKKWKIAWFIEGKKEAQTSISNELRAKPIYLVLVVFNEESEIEFM